VTYVWRQRERSAKATVGWLVALLRISLAGSLATALGCDSAGDVTEVIIELQALPELERRAERLVVRVWDTDGALALHRDVRIAGADAETSLPGRVPLAPLGGDADRTFRLVADLVSPEGHCVARIDRSGGYEPGVSREAVVRFGDAEPPTCADDGLCREGSCATACYETGPSDAAVLPQRCPRVAFVDSGERGEDRASGCDSPETPCRTLRFTVDNYIVPGTGTLINVHGDRTYRSVAGETVLTLREEASGSPARPTVLRAWPGTGRPTLDGQGVETGIQLCCSDSGPSHVVIEGFTITGAGLRGVYIVGDVVSEIVVRSNEIMGIGSLDDPGSVVLGAIATNQGPDDIHIEHNYVRDNGDANAAFDFPGVWIAWGGSDRVRITGNRIARHSGPGVRFHGDDGEIALNTIVDSRSHGLVLYESADNVTVRDNAICQSGEDGVDVDGADAVSITHNVVVDNNRHGVTIRDASTGDQPTGTSVRNSILAHNGGEAISTATDLPVDRDFNLHFDNDEGPGQPVGAESLVGQDPRLRGREACDAIVADESPAEGRAEDGSDIGVRRSLP
jgi:hypothetical protein